MAAAATTMKQIIQYSCGLWEGEREAHVSSFVATKADGGHGGGRHCSPICGTTFGTWWLAPGASLRALLEHGPLGHSTPHCLAQTHTGQASALPEALIG